MELPTKKVKKKEEENPRFMVIFGKPKSGKTTLISHLDDCLVVDFEKGSDFVEVASIQINSSSELQELWTELAKPESPKYKYIVLDTATTMEDIVLPLARALYRQTPMGKEFKGNVLMLPNGAGYLYLRQAFVAVLDKFEPFADHIILLGHTKDRTINKSGKELTENTLDLSGKLERIVCAKADAVGYLYREENKTILNFKGGEDFLVEARPEHLRGKEIVMMESDAEGRIITVNWDKVFISKK